MKRTVCHGATVDARTIVSEAHEVCPEAGNACVHGVGNVEHEGFFTVTEDVCSLAQRHRNINDAASDSTPVDENARIGYFPPAHTHNEWSIVEIAGRHCVTKRQILIETVVPRIVRLAQVGNDLAELANWLRAFVHIQRRVRRSERDYIAMYRPVLEHLATLLPETAMKHRNELACPSIKELLEHLFIAREDNVSEWSECHSSWL